MSFKTTRTEAIAFHQMGTLMAVCFHVIPKAVRAEKNYGDLQSPKNRIGQMGSTKRLGNIVDISNFQTLFVGTLLWEFPGSTLREDRF